ncbi:MAG: DUF1957 domain-containing protein [Solirubrobacterales bacterium]|nr:DUF1957 domain-containing protein [Solirubrobacterales bacterium]
MPDQARLAIVLHTHMPYVEGFGTWPFGEEWLWEAVATSYLPLLDVLDERLTLSLTPVLCDQLEAPGAMARCQRFLSEVRPDTHAMDIKSYAHVPGAAAALEYSAALYAAAADRLEQDGDLLHALGKYARWTSSATHAILPLLALDESVKCQLDTGIAAHRRRFGGWDGGFWLPECAFAPWLGPQLEEAGVHTSCVELPGAEPGRPLQLEAGPLLWPIDRPLIDLVWGAGGYPSKGVYRSSHSRTAHDHCIWANHGGIYDPVAATAQAQADAAAFVSAAKAQKRLSVFAIDTELLGHWWHEGAQWLGFVLEQAEAQGLEITPMDALREAPVHARDLPVSSWGEGGDLRTWSSGQAADLAFGLRSAELRAWKAAPSLRAQRELLAAQSSDWAFLEHRGWAGGYGRRRYDAHLLALGQALRGELADPALRGLAPDLLPT